VGDVATIRTRIAAGEPVRATRGARTLELVASGLGLTDLEIVAARVVTALDAGEAPEVVNDHILVLEETLEVLLADLVAAGLEPVPVAQVTAG
jgi:hypothetical protein